jgi:hypothetical protein
LEPILDFGIKGKQLFSAETLLILIVVGDFALIHQNIYRLDGERITGRCRFIYFMQHGLVRVSKLQLNGINVGKLEKN